MPLADRLMRLAAGPRLYRPKWSDQIMVEVSCTLRENFSLSAQKATYRENEIRRHFPEAWVESYENLIHAMTNHPKDRHVIASLIAIVVGGYQSSHGEPGDKKTLAGVAAARALPCSPPTY